LVVVVLVGCFSVCGKMVIVLNVFGMCFDVVYWVFEVLEVDDFNDVDVIVVDCSVFWDYNWVVVE